MRIALACLWIYLASTAAFAEERVALVIGNSAYDSVPALPNPVNDATAVGDALARLGFEVILGTDLDTDGLRDVVRDFSIEAEGADLALFFYAGHGLQVAGRNYLIPVDASLERESDLDFAALDLQLVLKQLERASANSVVFLDACRDNPFETRLSRSMGSTRSAAMLGRGLAPVETLGGALIGFATDPGEVAFDGDGDHSPFTEALLAHIETPGLEINTLMTRVRAEVVTRTNRQQRPWSTSSLLDELYLAPGETKDQALQDDPVLADAESWKAADEAGTDVAFRSYLEQFPEGLFAGLARARIAELDARTAIADPNPSNDADVAPIDGLAALQPPPRPVLRRENPTFPEPAATGKPCALCPVVVPLPGGRFEMGSTSAAATAAERPAIPVDLPAFALSAAEITVGEYRRFVLQSGYGPTKGCYIWTEDGKMRFREDADWSAPGFPVTDALPVACVNWEDALAYAGWLSEVAGRPVRLPSEAELEYAIRAGRTGDYPFDGTAEGACATVNAADASSRFSWRNRACEDGFPTLAAPASLKPNDLGLVGVTGNLWEWTADCWNDNHSGAASDGRARNSGLCSSRVLRGGSWDDPLENLRSAYRVGIPANRRQANVGFRVVVGN